MNVAFFGRLFVPLFGASEPPALYFLGSLSSMQRSLCLLSPHDTDTYASLYDHGECVDGHSIFGCKSVVKGLQPEVQYGLLTGAGSPLDGSLQAPQSFSSAFDQTTVFA